MLPGQPQQKQRTEASSRGAVPILGTKGVGGNWRSFAHLALRVQFLTRLVFRSTQPPQPWETGFWLPRGTQALGLCSSDDRPGAVGNGDQAPFPGTGTGPLFLPLLPPPLRDQWQQPRTRPSVQKTPCSAMHRRKAHATAWSVVLVLALCARVARGGAEQQPEDAGEAVGPKP